MDLSDWRKARAVAREVGVGYTTLLTHGKRGEFAMYKHTDGMWYVPVNALDKIRGMKRMPVFIPAKEDAALS